VGVLSQSTRWVSQLVSCPPKCFFGHHSCAWAK